MKKFSIFFICALIFFCSCKNNNKINNKGNNINDNVACKACNTLKDNGYKFYEKFDEFNLSGYNKNYPFLGDNFYAIKKNEEFITVCELTKTEYHCESYHKFGSFFKNTTIIYEKDNDIYFREVSLIKSDYIIVYMYLIINNYETLNNIEFKKVNGENKRYEPKKECYMEIDTNLNENNIDMDLFVLYGGLSK